MEGQELISWGRSSRRGAEITCPYPQPRDALTPSPTSDHSRFLSSHPDSTPFSPSLFIPPSRHGSSTHHCPGRLNSAWTTPLRNHSIPMALLREEASFFMHQRQRGWNSSEASKRSASQPGRELGIFQPQVWLSLLPVRTAPSNRLQTPAGRKINRGEEESKYSSIGEKH